jgi:hypothetical protein
MDYKAYLKKILELTHKTIEDELTEILTDLHINPKKFLIFIYTGGLSYTIDSIAASLYLSRRSINEVYRQKLLLLSILVETNISVRDILNINEEIEGLKKDSWSYERAIREKSEIEAKIIEEVEKHYRNCYTCADQENGCRSEDKDCKSPDYQDWREKCQ